MSLEIMKFSKKQIITVSILLVAIVALFAVRIGQRNNVEDVMVPPTLKEISTYSIDTELSSVLDTVCTVQAQDEVSIQSQVSGVVERVLVNDGDYVSKGDVLFEIENIQQRVSLQDARVSLQSAQSALDDLLNNNDASDPNSLLNQTINQQESSVESARNALFNNDLRAYPLDSDDDVDEVGPVILGNYTCQVEGEYIVEVYSSNAQSGASYRVSGLESGRESVSTGPFGTALGNCGLELLFADGFDKQGEWVIPVPNTRSASYYPSLKNYELALQGRDIVENQTQASPEQIAQQRGFVSQAQLRYQLALDNLSKTKITAQTSGVVTGFDINEGDFVSAFVSIGQVTNTEDLELITYVEPYEKDRFTVGNTVTIDDQETIIDQVSGALDPITRRVKITIAAPESFELIEGTDVSCRVHRNKNTTVRSDGGIVIPLSAVSIIGTDSYVFGVTGDEDVVVDPLPVVVGTLLGDSVVVYGLEAAVIARDARGLRNNDQVIIAE